MADINPRIAGLRGIPGIMGGIGSHCDRVIPRARALGQGCDIAISGRLVPERKSDHLIGAASAARSAWIRKRWRGGEGEPRGATRHRA